MKVFTTFSALTALLAGVCLVAAAEDQGPRNTIPKKLESQYVVTRTTDDKTDIVTAGSVLTLQKDKLIMTPVIGGAPCSNIYADGNLTPNANCIMDRITAVRRFRGGDQPSGTSSTTRTFVTGDKFWVTNIDVKDAGNDSLVALELFTDAIDGVRYKSTLIIPFKSGLPSPGEVLNSVNEVIKTDDVKLPSIAPPPPPSNELLSSPPTVSLGETPEQVVAILGKPLLKAKVGAKEIYSYQNVKVTFLDGKVQDIQ